MASFFLDSSTGNRYSVGIAQIEHNGKLYVRPTAATYANLGFQEITVEARPDDRFYMVTGPDDNGSYTADPHSLNDGILGGETIPGLRSQFIAKEKAKCAESLSPTDWYVIRASEGLTEVPASISQFRIDCRSTCDLNETEITAATTVSALEALVTAPSKVYDDEEEAYVTNPAPHLLPYPEQPVA